MMRSLAKNLLVKRFRLPLRLDAQLAREDAHTLLVLAKRGAAPAALRVQPHQRAMHRLLQRVERQQLQRGLHGRLTGVNLPLVREKLRERLQGQLTQPLALAQQPLLERRLVDRESAEQVALIDRAGLCERRRRALADQPLEGRGVDIHGARPQRQRVAVLLQRRGIAQRPADRE